MGKTKRKGKKAVRGRKEEQDMGEMGAGDGFPVLSYSSPWIVFSALNTDSMLWSWSFISIAVYLSHVSWNLNLCLHSPALRQGIFVNSHIHFGGPLCTAPSFPVPYLGNSSYFRRLEFQSLFPHLSKTMVLFGYTSLCCSKRVPPRQRSVAHLVCFPSLKDYSPMPVIRCLKIIASFTCQVL